MLNRREFSGTLAAMGGLFTTLAQAQGGPAEGTHFLRLASPVAVTVPGKVEVLEFFMYSCPHCFQFEPALEPWIKRLPADVAFRRVPVAFRPNLEIHQRLYYALEALGQLETLHTKAFSAIHVEHKMMLKDEDVAAWGVANGLDGAKLLEAMRSFAVAGKVRAARQTMEAYRVDGVPMLAIQGRWTTSGTTAGSHEKALAVADYLIAQARKTRV